jgi:hypothetical protein
MDEQLVKLWIKDRKSKLAYAVAFGNISTEIADAKMEILDEFYETFKLDNVTTKITYHDKV